MVSLAPEGAGTRPSRAFAAPGVAEVRPGPAGPTRVWARCRAREGAPVTDRRTAPDSHATRCYVLDTSVLLSDPWSLTRFDEHEVVLPLVVISELEGKRHHPELGWFARTALRMLDELRIEHGRLDAPVPIGTAGGTLHVELNHTDPEVLPAGFRTDSNDSRILACALNLAAERRGRRARRRHPGHQGHAAAGQGGRGRADRRRVPRPRRGAVRLDRHVRPGGHLGRHRRPVPGRRDRQRGGPGAAVQHRVCG